MKQLLLTITTLFFFASLFAEEKLPCLIKKGTATQLIVKGKPFLVIGGEMGNSSVSSEKDIEKFFPKLQSAGLNTVLVPAYWDLLEPQEGKFDFSLTDKVIYQARENHLKIVFLWFGAWKNSMSCYTPGWFKADYNKYPRAHTKEGRPLEIAGAFSNNVFDADSRAFAQWLKHIAAIDKEENTVIMIQVENEIGMLEGPRDYSKDANKLYKADVPSDFISYLQKNKKFLHPDMLKKWQDQGCKTKGSWSEVLGEDIYTEEIFTAWSYARYVERMAQIARSIYNVPLYVNAAMNSRGRKPGEYPAGGPLAHLIDVWHYAAPSIDLLAPDLYDSNFQELVSRYKRPNNPLFIPEIRLEDNDGVRAFFVFGEYEAIGFSPFSIEDISSTDHSSILKSYAKLKELSPVLLKYQGKKAMNGLLFSQDNKERIIERDGFRLTCRHYYTLPWSPKATDGSTWPEGGGIILNLNKNEYLIAGSGIVITFDKDDNLKTSNVQNIGEDGFANAGATSVNKEKWNGKAKVGIASVDEVEILQDGTMKYIRRLNGDQDHQGRHARISVGDFSILHVKLYEYQ